MHCHQYRFPHLCSFCSSCSAAAAAFIEYSKFSPKHLECLFSETTDFSATTLPRAACLPLRQLLTVASTKAVGNYMLQPQLGASRHTEEEKPAILSLNDTFIYPCNATPNYPFCYQLIIQQYFLPSIVPVSATTKLEQLTDRHVENQTYFHKNSVERQPDSFLKLASHCFHLRLTIQN